MEQTKERTFNQYKGLSREYYSVYFLLLTQFSVFKYNFQELRPPVKMLAPIWKALCAAIECGECTEAIT